ncbi:MAG TPA: TIM barrel protein [Bryobacteraceae bacterium]|nr:TIM barrel protein [Bryobacteraceae bacterium]
MYSRRQFGKIALSAFPLAAARAARFDSRIHGVQIGAQTYSFRDRLLDPCIEALVQVGLNEAELYMGHVEPLTATDDETRELLRKWRIETPLDYFRGVSRKFSDAGITLSAYSLNFNDSFTDKELNRGFEITKAMGLDLITTSTTLTCARRLAPMAEKHRVRVAMHGHDNVTDPNQFAKPESFAEALQMSKQFYINLDIGHFFAAGYDPVQYIQQMHEKILVLHIKDRKKDHGPGTPFGEGDTPIRDVLLLLRDKHYPIPANIEYEYGAPGMDAVAEVKKCYQYCKAALA